MYLSRIRMDICIMDPWGVCINGAAAKTAKKIIVQVNKHQPHVRG
jgi:acyl-CoA hydrolase